MELQIFDLLFLTSIIFLIKRQRLALEYFEEEKNVIKILDKAINLQCAH